MSLEHKVREMLGLGDVDDALPRFVVDAVGRHLAQYPTEDNFLITLDPKISCGTATCMEDGCYVDLVLTADPTLADLGVARGFGTLQAFQDHTRTPGHIKAHTARVGGVYYAQPVIKPDPAPVQHYQPAPADRKPSLALLAEIDAERRGSGSGPVAGPSRDVKPGTPLKRNGSSSGDVHSDDSNHSDKKPKLNNAANPAVLAANVNANNGVAPAAAAADGMTQAKYDEYLAESRRQETIWGTYKIQLDGTIHRTADYYPKLDHCNRTLAAMRSAIAAHIHRYAGVFGPALAGAVNAVANQANAGMAAAIGGGGGAMAAAMNELMGGNFPGQHHPEDEWQAPPTSEEFDEFLRAAAEGKGFEGNDTVDAAVKALGLKTQGDKIEGMAIPLMAHQLIGVSWMVAQEDSKNYGGILADEMGLGKTIQTIAVMAKNQSQDAKERTNLIVAPLALLQQWKEEIENRMERHYFSILIHHGPTRAKTGKEFQNYDVVLTTYQTLAGEWPDEEVSFKKAKAAAKKAGNEEPDDFLQIKKAGPLFSFGFFRVILDEAQQIRNRQTRVSRSVAQLDSLYRWCLTGTPITNSLADVFPLLRFCQIKPFYVWKEFNQAISTHEKKRPEVAGRKCQAVLRTCLLRRKKDSTLDGKPLVTLPTKTIELRVLEFSTEEREIYTFVEQRTQATFNKYLKAGTVLKNYAHVLVLLLRLRQLCFHPCLISDGFDALAVEKKDAKGREDEVNRALTLLGGAGKRFVENVRKIRLEKAVESIRAEKEDKDATVEEDDCPICMEPFVEGEAGGIVTSCGHTFCRTCITEVLQKAQADDLAEDENAPKYKADERPCPNCRGPISEKLMFTLAAFEPTDEEIAQVTGKDLEMEEIDTAKSELSGDDSEDDNKPVKTKQKNRAVVEDSDEEEDKKEDKKEIMSSKKQGKQKELPGWMAQQEPSTKMKWLLAEINRIEEEAPDDKFIIISSFTSALDLVDDFLRSQNIPATRYQGDMSRTQRDDSVRILAKSKKCKIMLMSLKGGVGLNLVRANRVINLDLAWSHAVEAQAFDRCHRLGQVKPVIVDRLTIANSVEQRIGEMQDRKMKLAEASLGEGKGEKLGRMTVAELAGLFGLDGRGKRLK